MVEQVRAHGRPATPTRRPVRVPRQRQSYADPSTAPAGPPVGPSTRRARRAMLLPTLLCGAGLLAGAATLGAVAVASAQHTSHHFTLPDRAGSLVRDRAAESGLEQRLTIAENGFRTQFGARLDSVVSAAYRDGSAAARGDDGSLVFVGAAIDTTGDPDDFVTAFSSAARRAGYTVRSVPAGPGAHAVCMSGDAGATTCAWSTGDSVGEVVPVRTGWTVDGLAGAMRTLRTASERSVRN